MCSDPVLARVKGTAYLSSILRQAEGNLWDSVGVILAQNGGPYNKNVLVGLTQKQKLDS